MTALYDSKLRIAERLLQEWVGLYPDLKLPVTFDSWYTTPGFCHFIDRLGLAYVGTLTAEAELVLKTGRERLDNFAQRLKQEHLTGLKPVFKPISFQFKGTPQQVYSYCQTHRVHHFGKVRLVINHQKSIMKKAKPKGWISINCGISRPLNAMLPWSPWSIAYCEPPNTTPSFNRSFKVNSSWNLRAASLSGGERLKPTVYGAWPCLSVPA